MNLLDFFQQAQHLQQQRQPVSAGETIFKEGELGGRMYVVLAGSVKIIVHHQTLEVAQPGDIFGEMGVIAPAARSATAIAQTDCELISIDQVQLLELIQKAPEFSLHIMRVLTQRLRDMNENSLYYLGSKKNDLIK